MPDHPARRLGDRGSVTAEMALTAPLLVLLLLFGIGAGRLVSARLDVADAAHQAARAATLARTPSAATGAATQAAREALVGAGLACSHLAVTTDTTAFRPGGRISVTVVCAASLSGLTLLPWPGERTVAETFTAPLETYRATETK
ncbi:pilus assembly protein [Kitasatospora sp. NBC_01287]|uniref:TadE/TadG family type IV pilus assembly protein n=1 Tax=Kitasatospora sp. NBC_01287 TaxID=2903573 RepID=UPI002254CF2A|nr:TadE/TadG family type IV pilus assembly protein [Kitasatospora sp. NBC_01287]MCX4750576.1 pilus assembly protein [Kitasatospora sp. NBC_01287]